MLHRSIVSADSDAMSTFPGELTGGSQFQGEQDISTLSVVVAELGSGHIERQIFLLTL